MNHENNYKYEYIKNIYQNIPRFFIIQNFCSPILEKSGLILAGDSRCSTHQMIDKIRENWDLNVIVIGFDFQDKTGSEPVKGTFLKNWKIYKIHESSWKITKIDVIPPESLLSLDVIGDWIVFEFWIETFQSSKFSFGRNVELERRVLFKLF